MFDGPNGQEQNSVGPRNEMMARQRNTASLTPPGSAPRPSISAILDDQIASLSGLHKMISELENRLMLVLAHDGPAAEANKQIDPPMPTQIGDRLVMHNRGIDLAQQRIGQLIQRLYL